MPFISYAYIGQLKSVRFNSETKMFESPLPFDEQFKIIGTVEDGIKKVELSYKIDNQKPFHYFPNANDRNWQPKTWKRTKGGDFYFVVGPLHPNTVYIFEFKFFVTPNQLSIDKKAISNELNGILIEGLNNAY